MEIKWMCQTKNTCGQTCVAMLAGVSLEESLSHFSKKRGTGTKHVHEALAKLGFKSPKKLVRLRNAELTDLPNLCIVKICWFNIHGKRLNSGHWTLYHNGQFYDPYDGVHVLSEYKEHVKAWNGKITSYLPVERS